MTRADPSRTLNGKHDSRCVTCGLSVYGLWVDDAPPPVGCSDGYDAEPWRCSAVYNNFVAVVIKLDHTKAPISDVGKALMARLGPKADELIAHIRSGATPEEWHSKCGTRRRELPGYVASAAQ